MTTVTCDLCDDRIIGPVIRCEMGDGEYPSNSSPMTRDVDLCPRCAASLRFDATDYDFGTLRKAQQEEDKQTTEDNDY